MDANYVKHNVDEAENDNAGENESEYQVLWGGGPGIGKGFPGNNVTETKEYSHEETAKATQEDKINPMV